MTSSKSFRACVPLPLVSAPISAPAAASAPKSPPARLWVVARKADARELLAAPAFRYYLIGETRHHYL